jgi:GH25 family lysozyme M1 (1,4-beta-N-acetylmuramidase)
MPVIPELAPETYDDSLFYLDSKGFMQYADDSVDTMVGVDVSAWQENIDWKKVADYGVEFAMLRVGKRGTSVGTVTADEYFHQNVKGALENGIKVGVYIFSQATSAGEAMEEAKFVLGNIAGYDISFPVVFDWESVPDTNARTTGLSKQVLGEAADAFCGMIAAAGYTPMVYANMPIAYENYDLADIAEYDFWLAQYSMKPYYYYNFSIWQYTSSGTVPGIPGPVDLDISFVDYSKQ